jgi:hypothetical protein
MNFRLRHAGRTGISAAPVNVSPFSKALSECLQASSEPSNESSQPSNRASKPSNGASEFSNGASARSNSPFERSNAPTANLARALTLLEGGIHIRTNGTPRKNICVPASGCGQTAEFSCPINPRCSMAAEDLQKARMFDPRHVMGSPSTE